MFGIQIYVPSGNPADDLQHFYVSSKLLKKLISIKHSVSA
jgi:hypothetical protein